MFGELSVYSTERPVQIENRDWRYQQLGGHENLKTVCTMENFNQQTNLHKCHQWHRWAMRPEISGDIEGVNRMAFSKMRKMKTQFGRTGTTTNTVIIFMPELKKRRNQEVKRADIFNCGRKKWEGEKVIFAIQKKKQCIRQVIMWHLQWICTVKVKQTKCPDYILTLECEENLICCLCVVNPETSWIRQGFSTTNYLLNISSNKRTKIQFGFVAEDWALRPSDTVIAVNYDNQIA